jgi:hypothetical protein
MTLPTRKKSEIQQVLKDAEEMAAHGKVRSGLSLLLSGLLRARADRESGEPWAEELIQVYDRAMDQYAERHELSPGSRPAAPHSCPACS